MAADRIFPNKIVDKLDNKRVYSGINWDKVDAQLKQLKTAKHDDFMFEDEDEFAPTEDVVVDEPTDDVLVEEPTEDVALDDEIALAETYRKEAGKIPPQLKPFIKKKKDKSKKEDGEEEEVEEEKPAKGKMKKAPKEKKEDFAKMETGKMKKKSSVLPEVTAKKVVNFTHPSQLSAEAVEAAIAAGDERLKNTILAARHQRRLALASRIEQARQASANNATRTASSNAAGAVRNVEAQKIIESHNSNQEIGFKAVDDLNDNEKAAFAKFASKEGFPEEYIKYMLHGDNEPSESAQQIIELIQNTNISNQAKVAAVKSMVKTAELTNKDLSYLRNYWLNVLGYDDPAAKEYVDALFSDKYNRRVGPEEE